MSYLQNAIKNKLANVTKKPIQAYYDRKVRKHSEVVDKEVGAIKDYRSMRDSGSSVTSTPEFRKSQAVYEAIKDKYKK